MHSKRYIKARWFFYIVKGICNISIDRSNTWRNRQHGRWRSVRVERLLRLHWHSIIVGSIRRWRLLLLIRLGLLLAVLHAVRIAIVPAVVDLVHRIKRIAGVARLVVVVVVGRGRRNGTLFTGGQRRPVVAPRATVAAAATAKTIAGAAAITAAPRER